MRTTRFIGSVITITLSATICGCMVDPGDAELEEVEELEQYSALAKGPVQDVNAAEATFRAAVDRNVRAAAGAAGVSFASGGVAMDHAPRNRTIASGRTTRGSVAAFLSRGVARPSGSYKPGLYELSSSGSGAVVRYHDPVGGFVVVPPPPPGPVEFHTPLGDDLCEGAPGSLQDYCQRIVACWAYDLFC
jgi:hypothetical protein